MGSALGAVGAVGMVVLRVWQAGGRQVVGRAAGRDGGRGGTRGPGAPWGALRGRAQEWRAARGQPQTRQARRPGSGRAAARGRRGRQGASGVLVPCWCAAPGVVMGWRLAVNI
ncbi:hypothetical protein KNE206_09970 [Kitasatospora sp. NE20-6]